MESNEKVSPVEQALSNHIILGKIIRNLCPTTWPHQQNKEARFVSHFWNFIILSQKPASLTLRIGKPFHNSCHTSRLEMKLVRKVKIHLDIFDNQETSLKTKLFFQEFGHLVEEIHFQNDWSILRYIFQNGLCPNLILLKGVVINVPNVYEELELTWVKKLRKLDIYLGAKKEDQKSGESCQNFTQAFVSAAPNLQEFKTYYNNLVDFSNRRKLEKFSCSVKQAVNSKTLLRMLKRCCSTLKTLKLESFYDEEAEGNTKNVNLLRFPKMPLLTRLELCGEFDSQIGRHLNNMHTSIVPNLKTLSLSMGSSNKKELSFLHELDKIPAYTFKHENVVSIILKGVEHTELLNRLKYHFPNLRKLHVQVCSTKEEENQRHNSKIIVKLISSCAELKQLSHLTISIPFMFALESLILALNHYRDLFNGLRILRFEFQNENQDIELSLLDSKEEDFEDFLDFLMDQKHLDIYLHNLLPANKEIYEDMLKLVETHKLPVHFTMDDPLEDISIGKYVPNWMVNSKWWGWCLFLFYVIMWHYGYYELSFHNLSKIISFLLLFMTGINLLWIKNNTDF